MFRKLEKKKYECDSTNEIHKKEKKLLNHLFVYALRNTVGVKMNPEHFTKTQCNTNERVNLLKFWLLILIQRFM